MWIYRQYSIAIVNTQISKHPERLIPSDSNVDRHWAIEPSIYNIRLDMTILPKGFLYNITDLEGNRQDPMVEKNKELLSY